MVEDLFQAAEAAYNSGQSSGAERLCRQILASAPRDIGALFLLARIACHNGTPELGFQLFEKALRIDPESLVRLQELALEVLATGRMPEALMLCRQAVRLKPDDANGHFNLGFCLLRSGHSHEAADCFNRAVSLSPGVARFHHFLGQARQQLKQPQRAAESYERAISLAPKVPDSYRCLAEMKALLGDVAGATQCYRRGYEALPDTAWGVCQLARALMEEGDLDQAEACLGRALELEPQSAGTHTMLGTVLRRLGRFDEARTSFQRALSIDPKRVNALYGIVYSRKLTEEDRQIVAVLDALIPETDPTSGDRLGIHYALGKTLDDLGDYENAIRQFDEANRVGAQISKATGNFFDRPRHLAEVDRVIETFSRDLFARHEGAGSESDLPVIVAGMARSGTTLVQQILSSHSQVGAAGELPFWSQRRLGALNAIERPSKPRALQHLADEYLYLLRRVSPEAIRVTDKLTTNYLLFGLIHLVFPKARLVHCRRNPADTCLSIYMTPVRHGIYDRDDIVFLYRQYRRVMEHWRSVLPGGCILDVDYEGLVADREGPARRMIEFCGLDWEEACLRHEENRCAISTPSVWQARQPIYKTSVERWRNYEPWLGAFRELLCTPTSAEP